MEYIRRGRSTTASAGEIILAGGAVNSPQLLLLSGVGPARDLEAVGIPVRHDLPGVGQNLQDHLLSLVRCEIGQPISLYGATPEMLQAAMDAFVQHGAGPLTSNVAEAGAFVRAASADARPGLQFFFLPYYVPDIHNVTCRRAARTRSSSCAGSSAAPMRRWYR